MEADRCLEELLASLEAEASSLERIVGSLQDAQRKLAEPPEEEIEAFRRGERPLGLDAYLLYLIQVAIIGAENTASDLQTGLEAEALAQLDAIEPSPQIVNTIRSAIAATKLHAP